MLALFSHRRALWMTIEKIFNQLLYHKKRNPDMRSFPDPAFHIDLENYFKIRYLYRKYETEATVTCGPRRGYSLPYAARWSCSLRTCRPSVSLQEKKVSPKSHKKPKNVYLILFTLQVSSTRTRLCLKNLGFTGREAKNFFPMFYSSVAECGYMTFWYGSGSGSADPYLWQMDLDSDPDPTPDPGIFVSDLLGDN